MDKIEKLIVMEYLNEAFEALDKEETRKVQDHISEVMEIVENDDSIPIHFMLNHLRKLKEFVRKSEEYQYDCFTKRNWPIIKDSIIGVINDWRLNNGQQ